MGFDAPVALMDCNYLLKFDCGSTIYSKTNDLDVCLRTNIWNLAINQINHFDAKSLALDF